MDHHQSGSSSRYQVIWKSIWPLLVAPVNADDAVVLDHTLLQLHNEEDIPESADSEQPSTSMQTTQTAQTSQTGASSEVDLCPPPYSSISVEAATTTDAHSDFYPVPPPYSVATSLPTYDEAEKAKAAAMAAAAAEAAQRGMHYDQRYALTADSCCCEPGIPYQVNVVTSQHLPKLAMEPCSWVINTHLVSMMPPGQQYFKEYFEVQKTYADFTYWLLAQGTIYL